MKDISPAARAAMDAWAHECMDYWAQFPPATPITEAMVEAAPKPPNEFQMDASAVITRALTGVVEIARGGDPDNPSPESILAVAELLDKAVTNALGGMGLIERREATRAMWDDLLDGPT
jgi:hypothetical protein